MFTGLVETVGKVVAVEKLDEARRLRVEANAEFLRNVAVGESIAVSGVCLTVAERNENSFEVVAVEETLRRTTLGGLEEGRPVNLERALVASSRLGGHFVQGHADGVAAVTGILPEGEGWWVTIEPPLRLMRYIVKKGSICLDGISLTVANTAHAKFAVALIPHTREHTTASAWEPGSHVNVEVDVIAKHVEQLMKWALPSA